eukprot:4680270-Alexandrium_andersonii.AAC.1
MPPRCRRRSSSATTSCRTSTSAGSSPTRRSARGPGTGRSYGAPEHQDHGLGLHELSPGLLSLLA